MKKNILFLATILIIVCLTSPVDSFKTNFQDTYNSTEIKSIDITKDSSSLTFYTFDKTGRKQNTIDISPDIAVEIKNVFEELEYKIISEPKNIETQKLNNYFINLVDENGLLTNRQSKDEVLSLLNPSWLKINNDKNVRVKDNLFKPFSSNFGSSFFCSVSGAGSGVMMPLFMLPRPRMVAMWVSSPSYYGGFTSVASLLTGKGFLAGGAQRGLLFGFMGIGLTYAVPGYIVYGFIGYSLFAGVNAEVMEFYPPNKDLIISDESPDEGTMDVPVSLSKLSFRITDPDGDFMSYSVTTDPDIGSGQGQMKKNGVYNIPISGLESDKIYSWIVVVSDEKTSVEKKFGFITTGRSPFDPFDEGWQYRKKININHTQVTGNLVDFPVLVSIVDSDLRDKAQDDGDDILFMDGPGIAEKLYHEIEFFISSSGELVAWVKLPSIVYSQDTEFYLYYGNPSCSSQEFSEKVWDSNFCSVWHLSNLEDSTLKDNDGTNHGTNSINGKIGEARDFEKNDSDYIDWGDISEFANGAISIGTFEVWVKPDEKEGEPICKANSGDYDPDRLSYGLLFLPDGKIDFCAMSGTYYPDQGRIYSITNEVYITTENWQHVVVVVDLSIKNIDFYYNGQEKDSTKTIEGSPPLYFYDIALSEESGRRITETGTSFNNGAIDEVRISKICRSPSWISTEYNNQNDPLSFLSYGLEESHP